MKFEDGTPAWLVPELQETQDIRYVYGYPCDKYMNVTFTRRTFPTKAEAQDFMDEWNKAPEVYMVLLPCTVIPTDMRKVRNQYTRLSHRGEGDIPAGAVLVSSVEEAEKLLERVLGELKRELTAKIALRKENTAGK